MCWEQDELITVAEIAAMLKLNPQTIRNWMDAGALPHLRVGERRVRVWRSDLQALINAGATVQPDSPAPALTIWDGVISDPVLPGGDHPD
jgi:excisionase family DNA binding protein